MRIGSTVQGGLKRIAVLVAVGGAIAATAMPAAPASAAKVPAQFFGLQAWDDPQPGDFSQMAAGNVRTYRSPFLWPVVEPTQGLRNWEPYDKLVTGAAQEGVSVLPVILGSPRFAAKKYQYPPRMERGKQAYIQFVQDLVGRYGRGGAFWAAHPELPYSPITAWQVWNEPNFPGYWFEKPNAHQYVNFLKSSRTAIRSRDPSAKVIIAGLPKSKFGPPVLKYIKAIYKVPGARKQFDVMAVHPYPKGAADTEKLLQQVRAVMRKYGDSRKPIWLTELGWATGGPPGAKTTSRSGQAKRLRETLQMLIKRRSRYRVGMFVWFSFRDRNLFPGERDWWGAHTGLFDVAGKPKPAWGVLTGIAKTVVQ